jgi:hypothetical protein
MSGPGNSLPPVQAAGGPIPLTFGQAFDRVFRLMRANLRLFLKIAAIPSGATAALAVIMFALMFSIVNPLHPPHPEELRHLVAHLVPLIAGVVVADVCLMLLYAIYEPAASYAALQADAGVEVTFGEAYGRVWYKAGRYLWLLILRALVVSAPIFVLAAIAGIGIAGFFAAGKGHVDPGMAIMFIPLIPLAYLGIMVYAVFALIWTAFCYPACVMENLTAASSISRSFRLTSGAKGRIFLLAIVIYAIIYAGFLVLELVLAFIGSLALIVGLVLHLPMNPWGWIGIGVGGVVLLVAIFFMSALSVAAYSTAFAVLYRDQRRCIEGVAPVFVVTAEHPVQ